MANIEIRVEEERGCGFRKAGGMYLISDGLGAPCARFPVKLDVCPVCHSGIKPSRGWTWINPAGLLGFTEFTNCGGFACSGCPMNGSLDRAGLLWVGEKFYPTPAEFTHEAAKMGVSRRISAIPNDFKLGETWVLFAHRKAIVNDCEVCGGNIQLSDDTECGSCDGTGKKFMSGIFHAFKPLRIEYVVTGHESEDELDKLEKRGFTLVKVVPAQSSLMEAFEGETVQVSSAVN
jgi:hypothetical protein